MDLERSGFPYLSEKIVDQKGMDTDMGKGTHSFARWPHQEGGIWTKMWSSKNTILRYNLEDKLGKQSKQPVPTFNAEMGLISFQGSEKRPVWLQQTVSRKLVQGKMIGEGWWWGRELGRVL